MLGRLLALLLRDGKLHPITLSEVGVHITVLLFDLDASRAAGVGKWLARMPSLSDSTLIVADSPEALQEALARRIVDLLVMDARGVTGLPLPLVMAYESMPANTGTQVIVLGVDERSLMQAERIAHSYLLPPNAGEQELVTAVNRAIVLRERWCERPLIIRTRRCDRAIQPSHVSYVESDRRKLRIHVGDEVVETYAKLSELLRRLPSRFVQCHKSFLVNMGFVQEIDRESIVLTTGARIPVSQKRRRQTREALYAYVGRIV